MVANGLTKQWTDKLSKDVTCGEYPLQTIPFSHQIPFNIQNKASNYISFNNGIYLLTAPRHNYNPDWSYVLDK